MGCCGDMTLSLLWSWAGEDSYCEQFHSGRAILIPEVAALTAIIGESKHWPPLSGEDAIILTLLNSGVAT